MHIAQPASFLRWAALALVAPFMLSACALVEDHVQNAFASRAAASAVVSGRLLQGQISWIQGRVGQIHLHSEDMPLLECAGSLQMTATVSGVANMRCNNGHTAVVPFSLLSPLRATGRGRMGEAEFSLTYGLPPEMAAPYLGVAVERLKPPPEPEVVKPAPPMAKPLAFHQGIPTG